MVCPYSRTWRIRVTLHPGQSNVVCRRENRRRSGIEHGRRLREMPISVFRDGWPHDLDRRNRWEISTFRRDRVLVTTSAAAIRWLSSAKPHKNIRQRRVWTENRALPRGETRSCLRRVRQNYGDHGEERRMCNQRSGLGSSRPRRFIKLQQMNRRAIRRRWCEISRGKKLACVFTNAADPRFSKGTRTKGRAHEWLAHGQTSVSASKFRAARDSGGHQSAIQKSGKTVWLPAVRKNLTIAK